MKAQDIKKATCYGAGTIGSSFAVNFAMKGMPCYVYVRSEESAGRAKTAIDKIVDSLVEFGVLTDTDEVLRNIIITTDPVMAFEGTGFIQENGPENYEAKQKIIEQVDKYAPAEAIFASSSSGLMITEMAKFSKYPERCIVGHPFNPPHLIPLVEMTKGEKTTQENIDTAVEFYKMMGKEPIVLQKEKLGFVANRLAHALWREEIALVSEGVVTMEEADKAICFGPGMRWAIYGPGLLYDLGGGEMGIKGAGIKFGAMTNMVFEDISDMKRVPDDWPEVSNQHIIAEKANMPGFKGNTNDELIKYRDGMLIEILKMHKKL